MGIQDLLFSIAKENSKLKIPLKDHKKNTHTNERRKMEEAKARKRNKSKQRKSKLDKETAMNKEAKLNSRNEEVEKEIKMGTR